MANINNNIATFGRPLQHKHGTATALNASDYVPAAGEIIVATDIGEIRVGDGIHTWNYLPIPDTAEIVDNYSETNPGKALDATKGKDLNGRISTFEGMFGIDCGEIKPIRYGYRINKDESDPYKRVEYLYDAVGLTPAHMDFENGVFDYGDWGDKWFVTQNKPLMLKYDRTVDYYLDPNDYTKKEDGTASDVSNTSYEGNAMAQIPLCWVKRYEEDGYEYEIISNVQVDQDYKAYAHTRADGSIADFFYWSMFGASGDANKLRSISGQSLTQKLTTEEQIAGATANGSRWYIHVWSQRELIRTLCVLLGKSTDTQNIFGWGNCRHSSNSSEMLTTGTLNDKGQFFGYNSNNQQVKVFHIEKFWGDQSDRTAGFINDHGKIFVKMTPEGEGYRINDVNGYTDTGITLVGRSGNGINTGNMSKFGFILITANGITSTYYCDGGSFNDSYLCFLLTGGNVYKKPEDIGAFASDIINEPSRTIWYYGCGLSCEQPAA